MRASTNLFSLTPVAAAAFLFGCLGTDGPATGSGDMTLNLSVKSTPECAAMKDELTVATGDSAEVLLHAFATQCVEEHPVTEPVEPASTPDPVVRCEWIAAEIDAGHEGLEAKYAHYCPEDCAALSEPEAHAKYCETRTEDPGPTDSIDVFEQ